MVPFAATSRVTDPVSNREYRPGLLILAIIGVSAMVISRGLWSVFGLPAGSVLIALGAGLLSIPLAGRQPHWQPGLGLASGQLLKLGVILVGLRLSLADLLGIGAAALPLALLVIIGTLSVTWMVAGLLGVSGRLRALLAVGTAICGTSAIAATAPALKARPEETAYSIACVAIFGLVATLLYPALFDTLLVDSQRVGLALGAAIHDTAQVTGAALLHEQSWQGEQTLAAATVTKLLRNVAMLAILPLVVILHYRSTRQEVAFPFPWFVLGFVAAAGLRTMGDLVIEPQQIEWTGILVSARLASELLFAMAMAAIGMSLRPTALKRLGWRPALVALSAALTAGLLAVLWLL